ncbi:hypothetical protein Kfla_5308 [Kribbella flavida DSM 17836]|uniref:Lipoprotein n=1 Tax=Kribbella flavida (strain DSM 17836 / JCM 10339 / NBRC 14399) TaxID=479435 RepID=D2PL67_KRIFD|nr:hypothetical protein [Kribbella flavida]ADB34322.1 hypothetical protein Kfla_5308 [Kribbella flavida DSM 17836]
MFTARTRLVASGFIALLAGLLPASVPAAQAREIPSTTTQREVCTLDGFVIDHLPDGLGTPSDFEYEWEEVTFHSRVWETGPDPDGATKVDLTLKTIRGDRVADLETLREFLTEYHEKDPAAWQLTPAQLGSYGGYTVDGQAFYFVSPGLAAELTIDRTRFPQEALLATAEGFHPAPA